MELLALVTLLLLASATSAGSAPPVSAAAILFRAWSQQQLVSYYTGRISAMNEMLAGPGGYFRIRPDIGMIGDDAQESAVKAACPEAVPLFRNPLTQNGRTHFSLTPGSGRRREGFVVTSPNTCGANVPVVEYKCTFTPDRVYVPEGSQLQATADSDKNYVKVSRVFYVWDRSALSTTPAPGATTAAAAATTATTKKPTCIPDPDYPDQCP